MTVDLDAWRAEQHDELLLPSDKAERDFLRGADVDHVRADLTANFTASEIALIQRLRRTA